MKNKGLACDLHLPVFDEPLTQPWPMKMSWEDAVRSFAATREHYMRNFDSPEKRLRDKNSVPFRLPANSNSSLRPFTSITKSRERERAD